MCIRRVGLKLRTASSWTSFKNKTQDNLAVDGGGHLTYLAPTRVNLSLTEERYPEIAFRSTREH